MANPVLPHALMPVDVEHRAPTEGGRLTGGPGRHWACTRQRADVIPDLLTARGVRRALDQISEAEDWRGPLGRELLEVVRWKCRLWARRFRDTTDAHLADDMFSRAWEVLEVDRARVIAANDPWAYLMVCTRRAATAEATAARLLTCPVSAVRSGRAAAAQIAAPIRYASAEELAAHAGDGGITAIGGTHEADGASPSGSTDWDDALTELWTILVEQGANAEVTATALDHLVSMLGSHRREWCEAQMRQDAVLDALRLDSVQRAALLSLLLGTRLQGASSSLWWRLREMRRTADNQWTPVRTPVIDRRIRAYVKPFMRPELRLAG